MRVLGRARGACMEKGWWQKWKELVCITRAQASAESKRGVNGEE